METQMDRQKANGILAALNFPGMVKSIDGFCRKEDGTSYDVWKLKTDKKAVVLKRISPEERAVYENFFPNGGPGVPEIYGFVESDGALYMLMEFFEGENLCCCSRRKLILALDAMIETQDRYWGNTELADVGWTFEQRHAARLKRAPGMGNCRKHIRLFWKRTALSQGHCATTICFPSMCWQTMTGRSLLTGNVRVSFPIPAPL